MINATESQDCVRFTIKTSQSVARYDLHMPPIAKKQSHFA